MGQPWQNRKRSSRRQIDQYYKTLEDFAYQKAASGDNATAYDNLSRLGNFIRGTLSASGNNGASGLGSLDTVSTASSLSQHSESWSLDALGNWPSQTIDGTATSRTHNSKNEVTVVGSNNLTFDNNGNTTTDQAGNTYVYDGWNRLISVTNSSSVLLATYAYDPRGWRIQETHSSTTTNLYYTSQWQVIEERHSSTVTDQYVWSLAYIDGMVLRDDNSSSGNLGISGSGLGIRHYAQQDANWNVTFVGNERYVYDPYGNAHILSASGNLILPDLDNTWNYHHQGGRVDPATGLYLFRHRDYNPTLGRWMQQDPEGYVDGLNIYLAEDANPIGMLDSTGLGGGGARPTPPSTTQSAATQPAPAVPMTVWSSAQIGPEKTLSIKVGQHQNCILTVAEADTNGHLPFKPDPGGKPIPVSGVKFTFKIEGDDGVFSVDWHTIKGSGEKEYSVNRTNNQGEVTAIVTGKKEGKGRYSQK